MSCQHDFFPIQVTRPGGQVQVYKCCRRCQCAVAVGALENLEEKLEELRLQADKVVEAWRPVVLALQASAEAFTRAFMPVILQLEDAGILESTYQHDLGEPEWEVFGD